MDNYQRNPQQNYGMPPYYNSYGTYQQNYNPGPRLSMVKNLIAMILGIYSLIFSIPAGAIASTFRYYKTHYINLNTIGGVNFFFTVFEIQFLLASFILGIMGVAGKTRKKGMGVTGLICAFVGLIFYIVCASTGFIH